MRSRLLLALLVFTALLEGSCFGPGAEEGTGDDAGGAADGQAFPEKKDAGARPADGGQPPDDGGLDTGTDIGVAADAGEDAGSLGGDTGDGGPDAGANGRFGTISLSYSEGPASRQGFASGAFYNSYTPGQGPGGSTQSPALDDCVVVQPATPCNPPECTPASYTLTTVGPITLTGLATGPLTLLPDAQTLFYYPGGDSTQATLPAASFKFASAYAVDGTGGNGYGAFSAALTAPPHLSLTTPSSCGAKLLLQDAPLEVRWSGTGGAPAWLSFMSVDTQYRAWTLFCQVANDGAFTIPLAYLEQLPADVSNQNLTLSKSANTTLDIPGMDTGFFTITVSSYLSCY